MAQKTQSAPPEHRAAISSTARGLVRRRTVVIDDAIAYSNVKQPKSESRQRLRRGTTRLNVWPPTKNLSPVYLAAADRVVHAMVDAGLQEQ